MRDGPTDSDSDLPSGVFFTYKLDDREEHLSPQELLAASETSGGSEMAKLYPFIGGNGVPQHVSHGQQRRVLGEKRDLVKRYRGVCDKENYNPRRVGRGQGGDLAEVHKPSKDLTEMKDFKEKDQNDQVSRVGLSGSLDRYCGSRSYKPFSLSAPRSRLALRGSRT